MAETRTTLFRASECDPESWAAFWHQAERMGLKFSPLGKEDVDYMLGAVFTIVNQSDMNFGEMALPDVDSLLKTVRVCADYRGLNFGMRTIRSVLYRMLNEGEYASDDRVAVLSTYDALCVLCWFVEESGRGKGWPVQRKEKKKGRG